MSSIALATATGVPGIALLYLGQAGVLPGIDLAGLGLSGACVAILLRMYSDQRSEKQAIQERLNKVEDRSVELHTGLVRLMEENAQAVKQSAEANSKLANAIETYTKNGGR